MIEKELNQIVKLVGPIKEEQLKFIDYYVSDNVSLFLPVVGQCKYSITPDHVHPSYLIIYSYDNLCKTVIDNKLINSVKGKISVISPNVIHHEIVDDSFSRYTAIMIESNYFHRIIQKYNIDKIKLFKGEIFDLPNSLNLYIHEFIQESENKLPGYMELLESIGLQITHAVIRKIYNTDKQTKKISRRVDIEEVIQYMNSMYPKNITTIDMSKIMKLSPSSFMRIFKQETGMSPGDFLISIRLERAKKLLLVTNKTITDIAFSCGFNSSSHFSTSFLKKFNVKPSEYKKYINQSTSNF